MRFFRPSRLHRNPLSCPIPKPEPLFLLKTGTTVVSPVTLDPLTVGDLPATDPRLPSSVHQRCLGRNNPGPRLLSGKLHRSGGWKETTGGGNGRLDRGRLSSRRPRHFHPPKVSSGDTGSGSRSDGAGWEGPRRREGTHGRRHKISLSGLRQRLLTVVSF